MGELAPGSHTVGLGQVLDPLVDVSIADHHGVELLVQDDKGLVLGLLTSYGVLDPQLDFVVEAPSQQKVKSLTITDPEVALGFEKRGPPAPVVELVPVKRGEGRLTASTEDSGSWRLVAGPCCCCGHGTLLGGPLVV